MATDALKRRSPPLLAVEQLHDLHRGDCKREVATKVEAAGVALGRLDVQLALARARCELVDEVGIRIERAQLVTPLRQVERDAPCAGTDVEDGSTRGFGQLPPQRQVDVIRSTLHVVPDDGIA